MAIVFDFEFVFNYEEMSLPHSDMHIVMAHNNWNQWSRDLPLPMWTYQLNSSKLSLDSAHDN